jgi:hypothetical protein
VVRLRRDRSTLVFLGIVVAGALLLGGVLVAILLVGHGRRTSPTPAVSTPATTIPPQATTTPAPPATTTTPPATTTTPSATTTTPPKAGPLSTISVGPFAATVEWTGPSAPARVGYGLADLGPTMWAPVSGNHATLTGLRFSTTYRVWAGNATLDLTTQPPPASPVAGIAAGAITLDGQPFFPLLALAQCPSGYESSLSAGITLYAENPCGGITAQTEALAGGALSLTSADEAGLGGPGVIGWYYPDEADLKRMTGDTLPQFPSQAQTGRLRVLTLSNHFYSRAQPLAEGRGIYPGLIEKADVVGFDLYPLQEFCSVDWMPDVAAAQRELVRLAGGRPTFQWIESSTWKCNRPGLRVTPATVRAESWLAVAGGARGLGFFPADWDPAVTPGIAAVSKEVAALCAALIAPDAPASASRPIVAAARVANGAAYVIAANPRRSTVRATISTPGLRGRTVGVVGEGRSIGASGDSFVDDFAPLAVHLYVAPPA